MININIKKNIAVIFGGISPEHDVSIITGVQLLNNIDKKKYNAIPIYVTKNGNWYTHSDFFEIKTFKDLDAIPYYANEVVVKIGNNSGIFKQTNLFLPFFKKINIDVIFPCMHGDIGEGGGVQGVLEVLNIPYVGSDILGSALGLDKFKTRQILNTIKIKSPNYKVIYKDEWSKNTKDIVEDLNSNVGLPVVVKPSACGSSIGISVVREETELQDAINVSFLYDTKIIVEQYLENYREINIAVLGRLGELPIVSVCEEVFHKEKFLTFEDKYVSKNGVDQGIVATPRVIPAKINEALYKKLSNCAKQIFLALNLSGTARLDFLVHPKTDEFFLIEANTIPGSMAFYLWKETGINFSDLITKLIDIAEDQAQEKSELIRTFQSNLLKDMGASLKSPKIVG